MHRLEFGIFYPILRLPCKIGQSNRDQGSLYAECLGMGDMKKLTDGIKRDHQSMNFAGEFEIQPDFVYLACDVGEKENWLALRFHMPK